MSETQYSICQKCLDDIVKDGFMLASYYQEICAFYATTERLYITPKFYRPITSHTMLEFLEMKGYIVTTEFMQNGKERLLVKPKCKENYSLLEFCGCD